MGGRGDRETGRRGTESQYSFVILSEAKDLPW
jgi:hypothetical protein